MDEYRELHPVRVSLYFCQALLKRMTGLALSVRGDSCSYRATVESVAVLVFGFAATAVSAHHQVPVHIRGAVHRGVWIWFLSD